jgi:ABC-type multidrug transport system fused ATPase/permease subunit
MSKYRKKYVFSGIVRKENSLATRIFQNLDIQNQKKIKKLVFLQIISNIFDLIGIIAVGLLTTYSSNILNDAPILISFLDQKLVNSSIVQPLLFTIIFVAFTLKTGISIYSTRKILTILSGEYAIVSSALVNDLIQTSSQNEDGRSSQETLYLCTKGLESAYLLVLGSFLTLVSDFSLLVVLFIGAFLVNPLLSLFFLVTFGLLALLMGKKLNTKMKTLGADYSNLNIKSNSDILGILSVRKEILLLGKVGFYLSNLMIQRQKLAEVIAKASIIPFLTKYLVEAGFLVGIVILGIGSFLVSDPGTYFVSLTVFLAAGARMTPAALRIQQGVLVLKNNVAIAASSIELSNFMRERRVQSQAPGSAELKEPSHMVDFYPAIEISNLTFSYDGKTNVLDKINLEISPGTFTAIVGASGSGKSTLINLLLGFLSPSSGTALISGISAECSRDIFPGKIGYVPQEVNLISGSIAENIALGVNLEQIDLNRLEQALSDSSLLDYVKSLPKGPFTDIGESGLSLSGGQKQRIGIARALYSNPELLILDEATSSLDGGVESEVVGALISKKKIVTTVVIAHRLSTVRDADQVVFIDSLGKHHVGKFQELRERIPDFNHQANKLGL